MTLLNFLDNIMYNKVICCDLYFSRVNMSCTTLWVFCQAWFEVWEPGDRKGGSPNRRQVKDGRNWPRAASRAGARLTARVNPTIHERSVPPCRVGATLAVDLGVARDAVSDPILETPIGRPQGSPLHFRVT